MTASGCLVEYLPSRYAQLLVRQLLSDNIRTDALLTFTTMMVTGLRMAHNSLSHGQWFSVPMADTTMVSCAHPFQNACLAGTGRTPSKTALSALLACMQQPQKIMISQHACPALQEASPQWWDPQIPHPVSHVQRALMQIQTITAAPPALLAHTQTLSWQAIYPAAYCALLDHSPTPQMLSTPQCASHALLGPSHQLQDLPHASSAARVPTTMSQMQLPA
jgi:hypothetical protein